ncbi:MAG: YihA family ribosome biogenesis GTP-binding protein [Clostridia bacterium]|nr:YihA family ribosome biogenesis GTP-binding protein [Clostridia bacterium]
MIVKSADFVTSVASKDKLINYELPEFAFVGRSNVGKSSLINALTNRKKLAKASSTPGRTRLINYFNINKELMFVDLPGYGFAQASKTEQAKWQELIGTYLESSGNLKRVFVLVDIRHEPSAKDVDMLKYLYFYNIPFNVIATKMDKIPRGQIDKHVTQVANTLGIGKGDVIAVSSEDKRGLDGIWQVIESLL